MYSLAKDDAMGVPIAVPLISKQYYVQEFNEHTTNPSLFVMEGDSFFIGVTESKPISERALRAVKAA